MLIPQGHLLSIPWFFYISDIIETIESVDLCTNTENNFLKSTYSTKEYKELRKNTHRFQKKMTEILLISKTISK